jgi:sRNA-binding protein
MVVRQPALGDQANAIAAKPGLKWASKLRGRGEIMAHPVEGLEAETLLILAFPRAFFPFGQNCRPLRVGIFDDLNGVLPPEVDRAGLKLYLRLYTGQPGYLRELKPGAIRIGLDGRRSGRVSSKEAASAAARLQKLDCAENGLPAKASASRPASTPQLSNALVAAMPHGGAINSPKTQLRTLLAESRPRKKGAQLGQQPVIVEVKRRKVPLEGPHVKG